MSFRRRLSPFVLLVVLAAASVGVLPARAAESVVFDATVTVGFSEAAPGFDLAGAVLVGAEVRLVARFGDGDPALQTLTRTTGPGGAATFSGVARSTGDTPVLLAIEATHVAVTPSGECTVTATRHGAVDGVVSEPALAIDVVGFLSSSTACPPGGALPDGVAADGAAVISVVGAGSGIPLAGVEVALTATTAAGPFQSFTGTTGDDGRATFTGVGRPIGESAVTLVAAVAHSTSGPADGCTVTHRWSGSERAPGAAGVVDLAIAAALATTITCPPPGPDAPVLSGVIVDASGAPVALGTAWLTMTRSDGARWAGRIDPDADGSFAVRLEPWGTDDDPAALEIRVIGAPIGTRTVGGCVHTDGPLGALAIDVALEDGFDLDPVTVVTAIGELGRVCGVAATPAPVAQTPGGSVPGGRSAPTVGPSITLPPTDTSATLGQARRAPLLPAMVGVLGALALLLGWAVIRRDA